MRTRRAETWLNHISILAFNPGGIRLANLASTIQLFTTLDQAKTVREVDGGVLDAFTDSFGP